MSKFEQKRHFFDQTIDKLKVEFGLISAWKSNSTKFTIKFDIGNSKF